jgi:hypothetical protein
MIVGADHRHNIQAWGSVHSMMENKVLWLKLEYCSKEHYWIFLSLLP